MSNQTKFTAFSFDASTVEPSQPLEPVPADFYPVAMTDAEVKPTSDGSGQRLVFELTIVDGPYAKRKIWDGLNIKNQSAQAQEIAHQQLSAICHAIGVLRLQDVRELLNKPFSAKIGFEPRREDANIPNKFYDARNTFKGAKPLAESNTTGAPAATTAAAPAWAKPQGAAPAPQASAPAPPATPPFPSAPAAAPAPASPPPPVMEKKLVMTAKANGLSAEDFRKSDANWTDELLVREVYAEIKEVPAQPSAPAAAPAAATPPGSPVAPPWLKK